MRLFCKVTRAARPWLLFALFLSGSSAMTQANAEYDAQPGYPMSSRELASGTDALLRKAWDDMLAQFALAREAIDDPDLYVPPASDRNRAEGYRYLLGYVYAAFERAFFEDPEFPYFRRAIPPHSKSTIDNTDNLYLSARIDGSAAYRLTGRAYNHAHWRGGPRADVARLAPQYVIFTTITQYSGDPGSMAGAGPRVKSDVGHIDSYDIAIDSDGYFEILIAPSRPRGFKGNFIPGQVSKEVQGETIEFTANYLIGRELFGDWEREYPLELYLEKIGNEGLKPPPLTPEVAAERMRRLGTLVNNQMRYWNEFYVKLLNPYGDQPGERPTFQKRNDINQPMFTQATTGGQATNAYGSGIYELAEGEALIIEDHIPADEPPVYTGFSLSNYWGESYDYETHVTSLNDFQAQPDGDGVVRYVLAHRDPGLANWLDTAGHPEGYMSRRWAYHEPPVTLPRVVVRKVPFDKLMEHLPADTRRVTPAQRKQQIQARREHVRRRYRES